MESGSAHPHARRTSPARATSTTRSIPTPTSWQRRKAHKSREVHKAKPLTPPFPLSHVPSFRGSRPDPKSRAHKRSEELDQKASAPYSQITHKASGTNSPPTNRPPHRTAPQKNKHQKRRAELNGRLDARTPARASPSASIPSAGARSQDAPNTLAPHGTAAAPHHQPPFPARRPRLLQP